MDEDKVQKALKQLKGLKYNKKSEEELRSQAEALVASKEQLESIDVESLFTLRAEQKQAVVLLKKYLTDYTIETVSDKNTLCQLIYLEILNLRLQESLNKIHTDTKTMPPATVELIHKNLEQVAKLKNLLGVTKNAKDQNKQDGFTYLQLLKKKYKKWLEENQASRTLWCIAGGSKVLTSNNIGKNIEDIKVGDEIFGVITVEKQGLKLVKQKVLETFNNGKKRVLKIKTKNGRELVCTPDHLVFSYMRSQKTRSSAQDFFPAENTMRRRLKVFNYLSSISDYYKGILLGIIESDGSVYNKKDSDNPQWKFESQYFIYQSSKTELDSIQFILDFLKIKYNRYLKKNSKQAFAKTNTNYVFNISTEFSSFIKDIKENLYLNKDIAHGFLAGFILGDGTIDKLGNIYIAQKNKCLLLESVLNYLNINIIKYKTPIEDLFNYSIRKQAILCVPNSKKCAKYNELLFSKGQHFSEDEIVSLELIDKEVNVYDLKTEVGNYIVQGMIVHNCPHCAKATLLKIKMDAWEAQKHPFFRDRILGNVHLIELFKANKLTREDLAKVFEVSPDYINWLVSKGWRLLSEEEEQKLESESQAKELEKQIEGG